MKPAARRNARQFALQAIYSWQISSQSISEIESSFLSAGKYEEENYQDEEPKLTAKETDVEYFRDLLTKVVHHCTDIDQHLTPHVSRPLTDIDPIEIAILRVAVCEMLYRHDVPHKVSINEAIELAKVFASEDSHKFVNGVLDKVLYHIKKQEKQD